MMFFKKKERLMNRKHKTEEKYPTLEDLNKAIDSLKADLKADLNAAIDDLKADQASTKKAIDDIKEDISKLQTDKLWQETAGRVGYRPRLPVYGPPGNQLIEPEDTWRPDHPFRR